MADPNRHASQQEAGFLRDELAADEDDLRGLRKRTERARAAFTRAEASLREAEGVFTNAKAALEHARALEKSLQDEMQRKRGLLHPARRLPGEIWSMIFKEAAEKAHGLAESISRDATKEAQNTVLAISSVSKRWRSVAEAHAPLWRFIHIELASSWSQGIIDSAKAALEKRRRTCLHRAAAFELDVVIRDDLTRNNAFRLLLFVLASLMRHSRSISVRVPDAGRDFEDSHLSSRLFDVELPVTETLILEARSRSGGIIARTHNLPEDMLPTHYNRFFPKCPKLRSIILGNFPLSSYGTTKTAAPNLRHIQLWSDEAVSDRNLIEALIMYPGVPTLRIHSAEASHIDLTGMPAHTFDHLRSLLIELTDPMAAGFSEGLSFPNLARLKIGSMDGAYSSTMCAAVARLLTHSCPNVTRLKLVAIHVDDPLSSACRSMPKLRSLRLGSLGLHDNVLFADPGNALAFPALRRLFIVDCECADEFTGQTLLDFARARYKKESQEAEERGANGAPLLKRIGVSWDQDALSDTHAEILVDNWDEQFAEAVGVSDFNDSSDEDELDQEFMRWDLWPRWVSSYGRFED